MLITHTPHQAEINVLVLNSSLTSILSLKAIKHLKEQIHSNLLRKVTLDY